MDALVKDQEPTQVADAENCCDDDQDAAGENEGDASNGWQKAVQNIIDFGKACCMNQNKAGADTNGLAGAPLPHGAEEAAATTKDAAGRVTAFKDQFGWTNNIEYDDKGRMISHTRRDENGKIKDTEKVQYNDDTRTRVSVSMSYDDEGGVNYLNETRDQYNEKGVLISHSEKGKEFSEESTYDDKGREISKHSKNYDGTETDTVRVFQPDGSVKVTCTETDRDGVPTGRTTGTYDKDEKPIGAVVSQKLDGSGNEVARVESTEIPGGVSKKFYENGVLKNQVDITTTMKPGGVKHTTEKHLDANGNHVKTIDADFFPRQPYLPTKVTVTNPDGTVKESIDIEYAKNKGGHLSTVGSTALIASVTHTVPPAEPVKTEYKTTPQQMRAWGDVFKASRNVGNASIPIGRTPAGSSYGPSIEWPHGMPARTGVGIGPA